jgi:transposase-like protein
MQGLETLGRATHDRDEHGWRLPALTDEQARLASELIEAGASLSAVARQLGVSRSSLYRNFDRTGTRPTPVAAALRKYRATVEVAQQQLEQALAGRSLS